MITLILPILALYHLHIILIFSVWYKYTMSVLLLCYIHSNDTRSILKLYLKLSSSLFHFRRNYRDGMKNFRLGS
jgi:hypothetical protein